MRIGKIGSRECGGRLRVAVEVEDDGRSRECYYEFPAACAAMAETERYDAFAVALLLPAMLKGTPLHIAGPLSALLLESLNDNVIPILNSFNPVYRTIRVTADAVDGRPASGNAGVGTGLSGGIDSLTAIHRYFVRPEVPPEGKITHLFTFNVGSHGMTFQQNEEEIRQRFYARFDSLAKFAGEVGLPCIPVDSNVHTFHEMGHLEGCSLVTPGTALLFQRGLRLYYMASSGRNYRRMRHSVFELGEKRDTSLIEPLLLPYFSTESMRIVPTENNWSRPQKTELLLSWDPARRYLNVCNGHDVLAENCSVCKKCCRTLLTLDILGRTDAFASVLDVERYRREAERRYVAKVLVFHRRDDYLEDLWELAREHGYPLRKHTTRLDLWRVRLCDSPVHNFLRALPGVRPLIRRLKEAIKRS